MNKIGKWEKEVISRAGETGVIYGLQKLAWTNAFRKLRETGKIVVVSEDWDERLRAHRLIYKIEGA